MANEGYIAFLIFIPVLIIVKIYFSGGLGLFVSQIKNNQQGKVILITGGSEGIGLETVRYLARNGAANIILASRSEEKGLTAIKQLKKDLTKDGKTFGQINFMKLDLNDLTSVKNFIQEFKSKYTSIDTLINNAGIFRGKGAANEGYEKIFSVNYVAPFLLTISLLSLMQDSPETRVINLSSLVHEDVPKGFQFNDVSQSSAYFKKLASQQQLFTEEYNYAISKLCNILFTKSLKNHLEKKGSTIRVYSLHPGVVRTALFNDLFKTTLSKIILVILFPFIWLVTKSTYHGTLTTIHLATQPSQKLINGGYYRDVQLYRSNVESNDTVSQINLWNKTIVLLQIEGYVLDVPQQ